MTRLMRPADPFTVFGLVIFNQMESELDNLISRILPSKQQSGVPFSAQQSAKIQQSLREGCFLLETLRLPACAVTREEITSQVKKSYGTAARKLIEEDIPKYRKAIANFKEGDPRTEIQKVGGNNAFKQKVLQSLAVWSVDKLVNWLDECVGKLLTEHVNFRLPWKIKVLWKPNAHQGSFQEFIKGLKIDECIKRQIELQFKEHLTLSKDEVQKELERTKKMLQNTEENWKTQKDLYTNKQNELSVAIQKQTSSRIKEEKKCQELERQRNLQNQKIQILENEVKQLNFRLEKAVSSSNVDSIRSQCPSFGEKSTQTQQPGKEIERSSGSSSPKRVQSFCTSLRNLITTVLSIFFLLYTIGRSFQGVRLFNPYFDPVVFVLLVVSGWEVKGAVTLALGVMAAGMVFKGIGGA